MNSTCGVIGLRPSPVNNIVSLANLSERAGHLVKQAMVCLQTDSELAHRYLSDAAALLDFDSIESGLNGAEINEHTFRRGLARWQVRRVLACIEENLGSKLTIARLSSLVAMSQSHFSRAFRQALGLPPMMYVNVRRVERAKLMMTSTIQPLCHIGIACGFADQSHFNRCFKRWAGTSPGCWRRSHESSYEEGID
jgi:AraC family transcriptional regulator